MSLKRYILTFVLLVSITSSSFLPAFSYRAQASLLDGVTGLLGAANFIPHVPTGDTVQNLIETVLKLAMKAVAQAAIEKIVQSTITWANTGFEGNPTYVTDPKQFAANTANSLAANFIGSPTSPLGFLCSPFQANIRIALKNSYYTPTRQQFQCTFSGIAGNLQNFYKDFSSEGWNGWFSMTQNPTNNPYDSYLNAQTQLNSQIANALSIQKQELTINDNFLSTRDCTLHNPDQKTIDDYNNGVDLDNNVIAIQPDGYDSTKPAGACIQYGPTKTPGKQIEEKVNETLSSGLQQLVNAKDIDDLISALLGGLIARYVTGPQGLFGKSYSKDLPNGSGATETIKTPKLSCNPDNLTAVINQPVVWNASVTGASDPTQTTYNWSGDGGLKGTSQTQSVSYSTVGIKHAAVQANVDGTPMTLSCPATVTVTLYQPLTIICTPSGSLSVPSDSPGSWTAIVSGGTSVSSAVWTDTSGINLTAPTENWSASSIIKSVNSTIVTSSISYHTDGNRTASVTITDKDSTVSPVSVSCGGSIIVGTGSTRKTDGGGGTTTFQ
jgi:hypothetical protein